MPTEYYRAARLELFAAVPRSDVNAALIAAGGQPAALRYAGLLDDSTEPAPYTVEDADAGLTPGNSESVVVLDAVHVQIDAGVNEIPRGSLRLPAGRSGTALAAGTSDGRSVAIGQVLEKYLGTARLPVKVFVRGTTTSAAAVGDVYDNRPWAAEWVCLFSGYVTHVSRQGGGESSSLVVHLSHFTEVLSFSSSLTGQAAVGPYVPLTASPLRFVPSSPTGAALQPSVTPYGAAALSLGGGPALYTDFWGYRVPADPDGLPPTFAQVGLKGWLNGLTDQDTFSWEALSRADLGGTACSAVRATKNDRAAAALARVEPFWPAGESAGAALGRWADVRAAVQALTAARRAAGSTAGLTRAELIAATPAYRGVGYTYGMPSSFYLDNAALAPFSSGRAFARDVAGATFADLASSSFWQLLVGRYSSNYQLCVVPMATRALVVPFQPLRAGVWQAVGASETISWEYSAGNPVPVRGVAMVGDFVSGAGAFSNGNNATAGDAQARYHQLVAGFDGCDDGVFEFRSMPPWLINLWQNPEAFAAATLGVDGRAMAALPRVGLDPATGLTRAAAAVDAVVGVIGPLPAAYAASGILRSAAKAPPPWVASTASRLAKSVWQVEKTRHNTYYATTRFRYDIGPGSSVRLELPADKYVGLSTPELGTASIVGTVVRVTLSVDREADSAVTHLQVGFVRTEAQAAVGSKLYADSHPFWATTWNGSPWGDSQWIRDRLGDGSDVVPTLLNPS